MAPRFFQSPSLSKSAAPAVPGSPAYLCTSGANLNENRKLLYFNNLHNLEHGMCCASATLFLPHSAKLLYINDLRCRILPTLLWHKRNILLLILNYQ